MLFEMKYTASIYFSELACEDEGTAVWLCGSRQGNGESKRLRPYNKIRSGQSILRSDWEIHTSRNVIKNMTNVWDGNKTGNPLNTAGYMFFV